MYCFNTECYCVHEHRPVYTGTHCGGARQAALHCSSALNMSSTPLDIRLIRMVVVLALSCTYTPLAV